MNITSISWPNKRSVLGVGVSTTSYAEVVRICDKWTKRRRFGEAEIITSPYVCVTSVHGIVTARHSAEVRRVLNEAAIVTPDGMPVVWALRSFGVKDQSRVYGPDLMLALCASAAAAQHRIFLFGARASTLEALTKNLVTRFPELIIAGTYAPPFRPQTADEDGQCMQMIRDARPDILFVGMSTPKQDLWMAAHKEKLGGIPMFGVGAAFDFHAGTVKQAPAWMQCAGLEWLFRFFMEPARLWRRYLIETPVFLPLWALQKLGVLRYKDYPQFQNNRVAHDR